MDRIRATRLPALALAILLSHGASAADDGETPEGETPPLEIEAVEVEPPQPVPETLCRLRVRLRNRGTEVASRFAFAVSVAGHELEVYRHELFLEPLAPGSSAEIGLHNFWSSETGRPFPKDGKLRVEVTLKEASWIRVTEREGREERTPLGAVEGLPVSLAVTLGGGS